jgi:hypothetical protein
VQTRAGRTRLQAHKGNKIFRSYKMTQALCMGMVAMLKQGTGMQWLVKQSLQADLLDFWLASPQDSCGSACPAAGRRSNTVKSSEQWLPIGWLQPQPYRANSLQTAVCAYTQAWPGCCCSYNSACQCTAAPSYGTSRVDHTLHVSCSSYSSVLPSRVVHT